MSLVAFALRTCTVRALRDVTLAGPNVFDSPVDPSDTAAKKATPTIFVYSDAEEVGEIETRALARGQRTIDLSILIVLPAKFEATVNGATVEFEDRKAGGAAAIDLIYRQIERALIAEETVWSRLWCVLVSRVESIHAHAYVLPVGQAGKQIHLPARGVTLTVRSLASPAIGQPPEDVWADFVDAMRQDPGLAPLATLVAGAMEGTALPQWRTDALAIGDTVDDAVDMGYGALAGGPMDALVPMVEAVVRNAVPGASDAELIVAPAEQGDGAS